MNEREKICFLVCAGERVPLAFSPRGEDLVIAVDGGAKYTEEFGIRTDLYLGDFDSLGFVPKRGNVIGLNPEKDETDTTAAVNEGLARGYKRFEIYCALGGRLSHTVANIYTLLYLFRRGAEAKIHANGSELFLIRGKAAFERGGYLSLLPLGKEADVLIENCKYSGRIHLVNENGMGVSNEPLDGASVEVLSGEVLAIVEKISETLDRRE